MDNGFSSRSRGARGNVPGGHSRGSPRGRGGGGRGNNRDKKRDMGRSAWSKQKGDKRKQNDDRQAAKRQKLENGANGAERALPVYATKFSEEDLQAEERRPKKKVAVLIGYSGTGYKGMQMAHDQKTIEGDLFKAFVAAGAISKANADDPKKSSFVRCARTDKGVHAAGNVISLKLIVEDDDIVQKINEHLAPQIRVWGYERTNNSFSAYQLVDSRIYEYLIPTHCFLPPHPRSYMGRKCVEWAEQKEELEVLKQRQQEVEGFWEKVDEEHIRPILAEYDEEIRSILEKALWLRAEEDATKTEDDGDELADTADEDEKARDGEKKDDIHNKESEDTTKSENDGENRASAKDATTDSQTVEMTASNNLSANEITALRLRQQTINEGVKRLRQVYIDAKRAFRIPKERLDRVRHVLNLYTGTQNFHNYTIQKTHSDPSAKRVVKSFVVSESNNPILIDGTEWLSLKVHGQSFMMHQIRKMVGMAALIVRCGSNPDRLIKESYGPQNISIPKAPSLGLLLERPVFDNYNKRATTEKLGNRREPIDFDQYDGEIQAFKQKFIYDRMYHDEQKENVFGNFFNHVDNFPHEAFLFVTSGGVEATKSVQQTASTGETETQIKKEDDRDRGEDESDADDLKDDAAGNEG